MDTLRESVPLCYSKSLGQQQANGSSYVGSPTESYDVITIIQKPTCVVRAALQSLEAQLQPRMVHLILDSCTGIVKALSAYRVRCVEFASALPHFSATAMARYFERKGMAQGKRQGWCASATHAGSAAPQPTAATPLPPARYYQQLVKLAVALQPEVTETVYMWDGDTIALRDFPPARLHDGRFPLLCANPLSPHATLAARFSYVRFGSPHAAPRSRPSRWGTHLDSPAYFRKLPSGVYSIPPGYVDSTEELIGVRPPSNISYVTQWQVWHKPFLQEMVLEIEARSAKARVAVGRSQLSGKARRGGAERRGTAPCTLSRSPQRAQGSWQWYRAVLDAITEREQMAGFSEYTLYGTWLLANHEGGTAVVAPSPGPTEPAPSLGAQAAASAAHLVARLSVAARPALWPAQREGRVLPLERGPLPGAAKLSQTLSSSQTSWRHDSRATAPDGAIRSGCAVPPPTTPPRGATGCPRRVPLRLVGVLSPHRAAPPGLPPRPQGLAAAAAPCLDRGGAARRDRREARWGQQAAWREAAARQPRPRAAAAPVTARP